MSDLAPKPKKAHPAASLGNTAETLREKRVLSAPLDDDAARATLNRRARRSFLAAASAVVGGGLGLRWLLNPNRHGIFDRMLAFNEQLGRKLFDLGSSSPEFPRSEARAPRVNGTEGLSEGFDPALWRLQVVGLAEPKAFPQFADTLTYAGAVESGLAEKFPATPAAGLLLTLDDIKALPRVELTAELKCIEGWSTVVHWAGARFSDFAAKYPPLSSAGSPDNLPPYVSLVTPDRGYYVGWDTPSILHPQTLLCYEMNGEPLTLPHGGPLRLVTTTKYGIKQIKRIGRIAFTHRRPPDFWAEQGYDWYSGL
jgi:Oxidoreductase molybdopterin binding domain